MFSRERGGEPGRRVLRANHRVSAPEIRQGVARVRVCFRESFSPGRSIITGNTRESTCKSSLIDRISRRTTHALLLSLSSDTYDDVCTRDRKIDNNNNVAPFVLAYFRLRPVKSRAKASLRSTPIINAFHYYRRTSVGFFLREPPPRSPLLLRRALFSASPSRADNIASGFLFRRSGPIRRGGLVSALCKLDHSPRQQAQQYTRAETSIG